MAQLKVDDEYELYELWEVSPTGGQEAHYHVADFEDGDYAQAAAAAFNAAPVRPGHHYYIR